MSQLQKKPTNGTDPTSADELAGNKLAQSSSLRAEKALAALKEAEEVRRSQMREEAAEKARSRSWAKPSFFKPRKKSRGCWC